MSKEVPPVEASTVEGQDTKTPKEGTPPTMPPSTPPVTPSATPPTTPTEPEGKGETPEPEKGEGKPEDWEQKFKTLEGINKQNVARLNALEKQGTDFATLSQRVEDIGKSQELTLEILSSLSEVSEETQEKVNKNREAREQAQRAYQESVKTLTHINELIGAANMSPDDEALKPAKEAFSKGDNDGALKLTIVAVKGNIAKPVETPKLDETTPSGDSTKGDKKVVKVITASPVSKDTSEMTPTEKIKVGLAEAKRKQE